MGATKTIKEKQVFIILIACLILNFIGISQSLEGSFESKFKRYQKNERFSGSVSHFWSPVAWKGERIHKQIVLWSTMNVTGLNYSISNLTDGSNTINSSNISLRFEKYIKGDPEAKTCAEYPTHSSFVEVSDALSSEVVNSISSDDPLKIWLTIDIPLGTERGNYVGAITVNGPTNSVVFDVNVEVVDYTLPAVENWNFHLDLWQFPVTILNHYNAANPNHQITIWSDAHFELFEPSYRLLADAGQKAITAYIKHGALGADSMIKWIRKSDGTWEYDFTVFEKYVSSLMSWGITKQINCFSPVGWNEAHIPYWDEASNTRLNLNAPLESTLYATRWDHFLSAFKLYLDSKGWFDKTVLYLDEVAESKLLSVASLVHGNNSNWKLGIAYSHALSNDSKANFYDLSGILEDASITGISENKVSTFYTSCTQIRPNNYVTPQNNPAEMTWMGWHAFKENYDGYLRWAFDNWKLNDPFDARDGAHTSGDFSMIYRASNNTPSKILSSIRFEMLRDGIQDYEKLKIITAQLENSANPYDQQVLNELNAVINNFDKTSGLGAEPLIIEAQQAIRDISTGTFGYCRVSGITNKDYYIKSVSTTGASENLNFITNQYPSSGYEHHTTSKVSVLSGASFTLNLVNSAASNCARTKIWIDWNGDKDFQDEGEFIFDGGVQGSCTNNVSYAIPITVPITASQGLKRIRIQVKDSAESTPEPCGINDKTGTADFDLEVLDSYCVVTGTGNYNALVVTTTGGITNINDSNSSGTNNYSLSDFKISIMQSDTFKLSVTNSNGWSRSIVWIDWNGDKDFEDAGERLTPLSPEKISTSTSTTPTYSINITVPSEAIIGTHKMRIVTGDAWTYQDSEIPNTPCGIPTPDGILENAFIKDFEIEIVSNLGFNEENYSKFNLYPNPIKTSFFIDFRILKNQEATISIVNSLGQLVLKKKINKFRYSQKITLPTTLKKGLYFLTIQSLGRSFVHKIVVLNHE